MAADGEVTYEVRADYSKIEDDLEEANQKVESASKKSAKKEEQIEKDKTEAIKKQQDSVTKNHQEQKNKQEDVSQKSAKNVERVAESVGKDVKATAAKTSEKVSDSIKDVEKDSKKAADDIGKRTENIGSSIEDAFKNTSGVIKDSLADVATGFNPVLGKVGELTAGLSGSAKVAIGLGAAAAGIGVAAVNTAVSMDQAMNSFLAKTGKGAEESERFQGILENIYKNNYGEDFQDIADAMAEIRTQVGAVSDSWSDEALQDFTESAFALRDTFDYDISESVRAANTLMNQFGVDAETAMSMIAAGAQNGLDFSGELLDSINEYSVHFEKVGLDADDMFKIFQKGADTGAWNLDKIGDAIKEMSIRVIDGSDATAEGFASIGLNADKMASKFAAGGESAREAFMQTVDALAKIKNPLEQNTAGVALFGTMWEDLGPDVVTQLSNIEDGAYDAAGAMDGIKKVKYNDLGSMFQGLKRCIEMLLLPLGEQLIPILASLIEMIMPIMDDLLTPLIEIIGSLIGAITPIIEEVLPMLMELLEPVIEMIGNLVSPIISLISKALSPLMLALTPIVEVIKMMLIPILEALTTVVTEVFDRIVQTIDDQISTMKNIFEGIIDFIKNVFTGNWRGAWQAVKDIFRNIVEGIGNIFKAPLNLIIDGINVFIKGLNKIKIPDWVPGVGGKGINIPKIPRLRIGMDYVPEDDFPAFLHRGEAVLTAQENALYRSVGGFDGIMHALSERGYQDAHNQTGRTIVIHNHMEVDGREVARSTAEYIGEQLPWEEL